MKVYVDLKCTFAGRKNTVRLEPDGEMHYLEAISQAERSFPYHKRVLELVADNGNNHSK